MSEKRIFVNGDLTSDDKFQTAMQEIEQKGFIPTHRNGDTGIGKTLEDELGIEESPVQAADLGAVELKATRKDSGSMMTLFTKSPSKRGVNNSVLRNRYGYQTEESIELNPDVKVLHTTVNGADFNTLNGEKFLKITSVGDRLYLEHAQDGILEDVYWEKDKLKKAFDKKYPTQKMYHVQAETQRSNDGTEEFHYDEASSLSGFSGDKMIECVESGELVVDIRLGVYASGDKKGKPHDNGTAIRVSPSKLDDCFDEKKELL